MTIEEIEKMIGEMIASENHAYKFSNNLARIGGEQVKKSILPLLYHESEDVRHLAARTLAKMEDHIDMLDPLLEAIHHPAHQGKNGGMVEALEDFDCSGKFVDIFKLYLSPHMKTSGLAKLILDYEEFDITPRVLRKAEKHWQHFCHNTRQDEAFEAKKEEVEAIFQDLKDLLAS